jgi:hypothetical protein
MKDKFNWNLTLFGADGKGDQFVFCTINDTDTFMRDFAKR